jgi:hypothetical protein
VRIGVRNDEDAIGARRLAVHEELRILGAVERERGVLLERRMIATDLVDPSDQLSEIACLILVARLDLVFL